MSTDDGGLSNAEAISISSVLANILGAQGLGSVKEICQDLLQLQYCLTEQEHYSHIGIGTLQKHQETLPQQNSSVHVCTPKGTLYQ